MARLKQNHAATGNLLESHGQLQGMRGSTVEIAFPNPGLVRAFGERHTSALAGVIQGFTGINVEVRGVVAGFGAPTAEPAPTPEPPVAEPEPSDSSEGFPQPPDPANFEPEVPQDWPESPAQLQPQPAEPSVPVAEPEPPAVTPEVPTPAVPPEEPTPATATTPRDSKESGEPRKQPNPQVSGEMKAGIQTAQAMLGGTIIDPKTPPGSPLAKAGR